jgi:uncharacterized membrane protein
MKLNNYMIAFRYRLFQFLIFLLLVFQVLDGTCTHTGIHLYGNGIEANPLIIWLIERVGHHWGLMIPKIIGISLILIIYDVFGRERKVSNKALAIVIVLNIFYGWVVYNWLYLLAHSYL